MLIFDQHELAS